MHFKTLFYCCAQGRWVCTWVHQWYPSLLQVAPWGVSSPWLLHLSPALLYVAHLSFDVQRLFNHPQLFFRRSCYICRCILFCVFLGGDISSGSHFHHGPPPPSFFLRLYLFISRERGREREREGEKHWCVRESIEQLPLAYPQPGTCPATQACTLTGNRTDDLSVHRPAPSPLSHGSQGPLPPSQPVILVCILFPHCCIGEIFPPTLITVAHLVLSFLQWVTQEGFLSKTKCKLNSCLLYFLSSFFLPHSLIWD